MQQLRVRRPQRPGSGTDTSSVHVPELVDVLLLYSASQIRSSKLPGPEASLADHGGFWTVS